MYDFERYDEKRAELMGGAIGRSFGIGFGDSTERRSCVRRERVEQKCRICKQVAEHSPDHLECCTRCRSRVNTLRKLLKSHDIRMSVRGELAWVNAPGRYGEYIILRNLIDADDPVAYAKGER